MLFSKLKKLLSNSDQLTLTIKKSGDKLLVSTTANIPNPDTEKACKIRQSLATPFVVSATAPELDAGYVDSLDNFVQSHNNAALSLFGDNTKVVTTDTKDAEQTPSPATAETEFSDIESL